MYNAPVQHYPVYSLSPKISDKARCPRQHAGVRGGGGGNTV